MEPLGRGADAHTHSGNPVFILGGVEVVVLVEGHRHTPLGHCPHTTSHHTTTHTTTHTYHLKRRYTVSLRTMVSGKEVLNTSVMSSVFISL